VENTINGTTQKVTPIKENDTSSMFELQGDKIPIALYNGQIKDFSNYRVHLENNDRIFLYTDGYRDQFGGAREKKIGNRRFKELIFDTSNLDPEIQKTNLNVAFETWKGRYDQIDDVCVFGFEIK
jgi:serine phosphatase RsbU (regulator of sigma subunit)